MTAFKTALSAVLEMEPLHGAANSRACAGRPSRSIATWHCPLSSHSCLLILQLTEDGVLFFRESCFKPSGDKKRGNNPTHYR